MLIRFTPSAGENRAKHPMLLDDSECTKNNNSKPGHGDLRPWRDPLSVASVPANRKTIYRMGRDVASDSQYWLSWSTRAYVMRGFSSDDTTERTYYTDQDYPKVTDNIMALSSSPYPATHRPLGVPAPATKLLASVNSGTWTGSTTTYFYVYTFVNDWGWESAPSPVSAQIDRPSDATVTLSGFATASVGSYFINRIRIYRTQSGSTGTDYYFLREIAYGTTSTTDDNRTLGEVLATRTWITPPDNLSNLTPMWNGMAAGISGNGVRFCVAYAPYAWPIAYEAIPPDSKPVALGVFGQQLLVLTTGRPLLVAGSSPDSLDQAPLEFWQSCIAPNSVASVGMGVAWASGDGLCWYGAGGARILTAGFMTRDEWQALNPSSIVGNHYKGLYIGSYDDGSGRKAFIIELPNPTDIRFLDKGYECMHHDTLQGQLYVLDGTEVKRWDAATSFMTTFARSKVFRMPHPVNFACAEVVASSYPVTFRLYGDGTIKHTEVVTGRDPFWLPSGYAARDWQIEIQATHAVQGVAIASSTDEIKGV